MHGHNITIIQAHRGTERRQMKAWPFPNEVGRGCMDTVCNMRLQHSISDQPVASRAHAAGHRRHHGHFCVASALCDTWLPVLWPRSPFDLMVDAVRNADLPLIQASGKSTIAKLLVMCQRFDVTPLEQRRVMPRCWVRPTALSGVNVKLDTHRPSILSAKT